ncbi:MAG: VWA domain-containing protein [bacterium]|nr:VWA domain-containing protein [bacterium]
MQFGALEYIHGLWVVVGVALFLWWSWRRGRELLERFAHVEMLRRMMGQVSMRKKVWKQVLIVLGLTMVVVALMEPKWGYTWERVVRRGVDVVVAVDVSRSMLATDMKPSRLERAKRSVLDLLNIMEGDRVGLIAFAGGAYILCPLTLDYGACKMFVDELGPQLVSRGGTRIGDAIRKAITVFEGQEKKHRALILITDGEDHESEPVRAAEEAAKHGIRIFCIGIGSVEGSPIQVQDGEGRQAYLRDRSGRVVLSKLGEETLKRIAYVTGGAYVRATATGLELDILYRERIATMEQKELESSRQKRYVQRFQWPLGLAALAVIGEALIDDRRRAKAGGER